MNTPFQPRTGRGFGFGTFLLAAVVVAQGTLAISADTSFTTTGYVYQVPSPGVLVTNALGQVLLQGNVHLAMMQSPDARATGRFQAGMDLAYQPDGTALFGGPAYFELGTWQNQTNFTPTGGLWVMQYRGVSQMDNSSQMTITGYGIGGSIDLK